MHYIYMPPDNIYMGEWKPMYEDEAPPVHSTTIPPLLLRKYFQCVWETDRWVYKQAPFEPGETMHPLDAMLSYADCRKMEYPDQTDYIDGIVKASQFSLLRKDYII